MGLFKFHGGRERDNKGERVYDPWTGGSIIEERNFDRIGLDSGRQNPTHDLRRTLTEGPPKEAERRTGKGVWGDMGHGKMARSRQDVYKKKSGSHQSFLFGPTPGHSGTNKPGPQRSNTDYFTGPSSSPSNPGQPWWTNQHNTPQGDGRSSGYWANQEKARGAGGGAPHKRGETRHGKREDTGWF